MLLRDDDDICTEVFCSVIYNSVVEANTDWCTVSGRLYTGTVQRRGCTEKANRMLDTEEANEKARL